MAGPRQLHEKCGRATNYFATQAAHRNSRSVSSIRSFDVCRQQGKCCTRFTLLVTVPSCSAARLLEYSDTFPFLTCIGINIYKFDSFEHKANIWTLGSFRLDKTRSLFSDMKLAEFHFSYTKHLAWRDNLQCKALPNSSYFSSVKQNRRLIKVHISGAGKLVMDMFARLTECGLVVLRLLCMRLSVLCHCGNKCCIARLPVQE